MNTRSHIFKKNRGDNLDPDNVKSGVHIRRTTMVSCNCRLTTHNMGRCGRKYCACHKAGVQCNALCACSVECDVCMNPASGENSVRQFVHVGVQCCLPCGQSTEGGRSVDDALSLDRDGTPHTPNTDRRGVKRTHEKRQLYDSLFDIDDIDRWSRGPVRTLFTGVDDIKTEDTSWFETDTFLST